MALVHGGVENIIKTDCSYASYTFFVIALKRLVVLTANDSFVRSILRMDLLIKEKCVVHVW